MMTVRDPRLAAADAASADDRPHAAVIGAGFGGLAAAMRLGARGYRVTVFERNEQPGGRASVFQQDGFAFDAGPTIVTAPFVLEELWAACGRRFADDVTLEALDPFYRIRFDDGETLDCFAGADAMKAEIARLSPGDVAGFDRYMAESAANYRVGFEKLGTVPFSTLWSMVRALPELMAKRADRSVWGHVARHIRHPKIRQALSFHPLFIGGDPTVVTSVYSLIAHLERAFGVHFVMGGTGALVAAMVRLIEAQGGAVLTGTDVARIEHEGGRATGVALADGLRVAADVVVSNADPYTTYASLLPGWKAKRWSEGKLRRAKHSMGVVVWYFGTDRRWDDVHHHTIVLGPRYRGLIRDIFRRKRLADDMSLYLHRPTATDRSLAPEGGDAFYVLAPVPNLEGETDWEAMAEPYRARVEARLEETVLPGLGRHVVSSKLMTPLDFRDRYRSHLGAGFGLEPRLTQSAWFRPHNVSEELEGLYLVGASTHPGAGVPGVLCTAAILDDVVPHADAHARR